MKPIPLVLAICASLAAAIVSAVAGVAAWRIYVEVQEFRLADDASTPALKAKYLGDFLARIDSLALPEHSAFVLKHQRNRVADQRMVLESLKQRCEELAKVDPKELGYAQGMQQITGQEFEHALGRVQGVFYGAMWVKRGYCAAWGWAWAWGLAVFLWSVTAGSYSQEY